MCLHGLCLISLLTALVILLCSINRSCSSYKVVHLAGLAGSPHSSSSYTHVTANTACSHEHAKTISSYRKAGHRPRGSDLAWPKMWHLPLFIVHMMHPQFCLSSLPPIQHLLLSLLPSSPVSLSHTLIPLHTSINRALQSAQSHTVLNAAVVQLQWAAIDLYHWIKRGQGEKPSVLKLGTSPTPLSFTPHFPWTDA